MEPINVNIKKKSYISKKEVFLIFPDIKIFLIFPEMELSSSNIKKVL